GWWCSAHRRSVPAGVHRTGAPPPTRRGPDCLGRHHRCTRPPQGGDLALLERACRPDPRYCVNVLNSRSTKSGRVLVISVSPTMVSRANAKLAKPRRRAGISKGGNRRPPRSRPVSPVINAPTPMMTRTSSPQIPGNKFSNTSTLNSSRYGDARDVAVSSPASTPPLGAAAPGPRYPVVLFYGSIAYGTSLHLSDTNGKDGARCKQWPSSCSDWRPAR